MKRTTDLVVRLSDALDELGYHKKPRAFERWSHLGLGPDRPEPLARQVAHFAKLAELSSSGRDANATARRMAAYGFKCERLRLALKVPLLVDPVGVPVPDLDFSVGPEGNEAFRFVEGEARSMLSDLANLPPMMVNLLGALFANADRYSAKLDDEPAASTFYSVVVSILCHLMGGEIFNVRGLVAMCNLDPDELSVDDEEQVKHLDRLDPNELVASYANASIDDIVVVAEQLREEGSEVLDHIGMTGLSDAQIEELAAWVAPAGVCLVYWMSRQFPGFPPLLPSMNEAA